MGVRILYFAGLRDAIGVAEEDILLPSGVTTVGALRDWLAGEGGRAALRESRNLRCARNQEMAGWQTAVADGDEIAFFPPVTGG